MPAVIKQVLDYIRPRENEGTTRVRVSFEDGTSVVLKRHWQNFVNVWFVDTHDPNLPENIAHWAKDGESCSVLGHPTTNEHMVVQFAGESRRSVRTVRTPSIAIAFEILDKSTS